MKETASFFIKKFYSVHGAVFFSVLAANVHPSTFKRILHAVLIYHSRTHDVSFVTVGVSRAWVVSWLSRIPGVWENHRTSENEKGIAQENAWGSSERTRMSERSVCSGSRGAEIANRLRERLARYQPPTTTVNSYHLPFCFPPPSWWRRRRRRTLPTPLPL